MPQAVEIHGRDNIVIQIQGDGNTVVPHLAHLTVTRYLARRRPAASEPELLSPYALTIPLVGREEVMQNQWRWLKDARPISIRVLVGRAGSGKTRLALELCESAIEAGWDAGFVTSDELARFRSQQNLSTWGWRRPTLLVIDYAAAQARHLREWLIELSNNPGNPEKPLRMLLLERHADAAGGWWETTFGPGGWDAEAVRRLLDPPSPVQLPGLVNPEDRRRVFAAILERANTGLRVPARNADPAFDRRLAELTWGGEPLFLMMAGLSAAQKSLAEALALGRADLAFFIARREMSRIEEIARGHRVDARLLVHMAAYVTLCQGLGRDALEDAVREEKEALQRLAAGDPPAVADALCDALPNDNGAVEPVRPDMLGEAVILLTLEPPRLSRDAGRATVVRAARRAGPQVASAVIRTVQDYVPEGRAAPLDWLDNLVQAEDAGLDRLLEIADALPLDTFVLRERAANIRTTIVERLRAVRARSTPRVNEAIIDVMLAGSVNDLAVRLSALGRREEALAAAQEAVVMLAPYFLVRPTAFARWMEVMIGNYLRLSQQLGYEPDATLLEPILQAFGALSATTQNSNAEG